MGDRFDGALTSLVLRKCIQAIDTSNLVDTLLKETFLMKTGLHVIFVQSVQEHRPT